MLPTPVSGVLFDLDGTLLDTAPDFIRTLNQLRIEENLPPLPCGQIRNEVSNGASALIRLGFGSTLKAERQQHLLQRLLGLYKAGLTRETTLFDGMEPLLDWLESHQIPWGVVTNKPLEYSAPIMSGLQLAHRCATLICPDHVKHRKPHPEPLLLACSQLQAAPEHCLYVGDHERDIESGRRAGMLTVAALYGYLSPADTPENWQSDLQINNPSELLTLLKTHDKS